LEGLIIVLGLVGFLTIEGTEWERRGCMGFIVLEIWRGESYSTRHCERSVAIFDRTVVNKHAENAKQMQLRRRKCLSKVVVVYSSRHRYAGRPSLLRKEDKNYSPYPLCAKSEERVAHAVPRGE
jgi:hypothetical protein